jgi:hypothetical protein
MFSSLAPTNLFKISGPFTTLGSRALSIFPICLAIKVFPVPGGPKSRIPRHEHSPQPIRLTLDVLDTELLNQTWREDSTSECSSENGREFSIETSNTHILEFEVGGQDGIGRGTWNQLQSSKSAYRLEEFFSLMLLVGSLTQMISVPSIMIPVAPSFPSSVATVRTVAFSSCPR